MALQGILTFGAALILWTGMAGSAGAQTVVSARVEITRLTLEPHEGRRRVMVREETCELNLDDAVAILAEAEKLEGAPYKIKGIGPDFVVRFMMSAGPDLILLVDDSPESSRPAYENLPPDVAVVGFRKQFRTVPKAQVKRLVHMVESADCDRRVTVIPAI